MKYFGQSLGQTWSKSQKVKVTHFTTARVTCGTSIQLTWQSVELAWDDMEMSYRFDGRHVGELGCDKWLAHNQVWGIFLEEMYPATRRGSKNGLKIHLSQGFRSGRIILMSTQIWTTKICAPRSTAEVPFQIPLVVLPLLEGGGVSGMGCTSLNG
jgi:hypothetical protein